jgi:hypothetical protein
MNTSPLQRSLSKVFPNKTIATAAEVIFLLLLGMFAIALHSKLRIPMHLPGKQGILFVALVVTGRGLSRLPFAASITCAGSSLLLLTSWLGFHDPFIAITYILLGGLMDLIYNFSHRYSERPWILALASGFAWMFIPLFRLFLSLFVAIPMNSFSSGIAYPFLTHLLFGFSGGLIGAGILSLINLRK